ncbi:MAG: adenylate/guanylate cyclase domain-containing protein [Actinomycetota bacterium]|nr:adenylate/guanylate cyclase domain-containing protein [Actinomycetota bacterium]
MTQVADDPLAIGREAAKRGAYKEAYGLLSPTADSLGAEDLELLADAAYWTGKLDEAVELRERAHAAYLRDGEKTKAAMLALVISQDYWGKAALSVSSGWFCKAERLLEDEPESVAHGYLAFAHGINAATEGDLDKSIARMDDASEFAKRYSDPNLDAIARVLKGRSLVLKGDTAAGLTLLDEATAAAVSGELQPYATGLIYCCTITSCHGVGDYRRAAEWTEAASRWCDRQDLAGFPGACRVHHASMMRLRGDWSGAEAQAVQACEELRGYDAWTTAAGFYEIGEIRRRRGDFAAAEDAYAQAKEWGRDPHPGLALLRLAQGKTDAAAAAIKRALAATSDPVARIRRLPAQVEIALAAGEFRTAREAAAELESLADAYKVGAERTPAFEAAVCLAWGQIRLAENDPEGAIRELERAVGTWRAIGAPYEVAEAQMLLGFALQRSGDEDGARDELVAAKGAFERLGAALAAERAAELLGEHKLHRTFMFTDIVDSTKLVEVLGEDKWKKLLGWHDRTLRELISDKGGEVIKQTGDGYFAAFQNPGAALEAAVGIQRALDAHEPLAPDVRIGLHTGGAFHRADDDYSGQGVHVAARIGALAAGGEILASRASLSDGAARFRISEARKTELKGVADTVELVSIEWR